VRYASIKALTRICKSLQEKEYEEIRQTCWSCLVVFQETEINGNVLEALKVGQVTQKSTFNAAQKNCHIYNLF